MSTGETVSQVTEEVLGVGVFWVTADYSKAQIITVSENGALKELQFCSNSSSV